MKEARGSSEDTGFEDGAVEKTRTSTGYYPTATSTLRVYQFRHDRQGASGIANTAQHRKPRERFPRV